MPGPEQDDAELPTTTVRTDVENHLPRDLPTLTSWRAFAALLVLTFHLDLFGVIHLPGASLGYTGVGFFFVLSGFVLTWSTSPTTTATVFYRRRFARIYPSHFVMLVVSFASKVIGGSGAPAPLIVGTNLLLVQAWSSNSGVAFGMNGVAWSLSCEAAFYAAFPFVVWWLRARRQRAAWTLAALWLACVACASTLGDRWSAEAYHLPAARMGEFVLGMACALAIQRGWRPRLRVSQAVLIVVVSFALLEQIQSRRGALPSGLVDAVMAPAFAGVMLASCASDVLGRTRLLAHPVLIYAGQVSFAFYLVHQIVIITLSRFELSGYVGASIDLVAAIVAAIGLHHLVERPMQKALTRSRPARVAVR